MVKRKMTSGSSRIMGAALMMIVLALVAACAAQKAPQALDAESTEAAKVTSVRVETTNEADRVLIATEPDSIPYSVYKWVDPMRVVVDIASAVSAQDPSTIPVADGFIQEIEVRNSF